MTDLNSSQYKIFMSFLDFLISINVSLKASVNSCFTYLYTQDYKGETFNNTFGTYL